MIASSLRTVVRAARFEIPRFHSARRLPRLTARLFWRQSVQFRPPPARPRRKKPSLPFGYFVFFAIFEE
jgi:hypothetical protein